jgi:hypothetical protein
MQHVEVVRNTVGLGEHRGTPQLEALLEHERRSCDAFSFIFGRRYPSQLGKYINKYYMKQGFASST